MKKEKLPVIAGILSAEALESILSRGLANDLLWSTVSRTQQQILSLYKPGGHSTQVPTSEPRAVYGSLSTSTGMKQGSSYLVKSRTPSNQSADLVVNTFYLSNLLIGKLATELERYLMELMFEGAVMTDPREDT